VDFDQILDQTIEMLQRRRRLTYRTLKRQFQLDDEALEDLKEAILFSHPQAIDEEGRGLVWTGEPASTSRDASATDLLSAQTQAPWPTPPSTSPTRF